MYVAPLPAGDSVCVTNAQNSVMRTTEQAKSFVNNRTGNYVGSWNGSTPVPAPGILRGATIAVWGSWIDKFKMTRYCRLSFGGGDGWGGEVETVNPPAPPPSLCSLNNQTINMTFSENNLNVSGLSKKGNLNISCTSGTPSNYTLRLTGTNTTNGRLSFGNGVSAQISINGSDVAVNGAGISLPSLTNQTLPLDATLLGTASGPGVTNTYGVLVMEAQ